MEIEKKYIVSSLPANLDTYAFHEISQGYLSTEPVLRIRQRDDDYILTYKSKGLMIREEHEFPLTAAAYAHLQEKVDGNMITKRRYLIPMDNGLTIELDIFHGSFEGLIIAEVEFPDEASALSFQAPDWFAVDVTNDGHYHNSFLSQASQEEIDYVLSTMQ